MKKRSLCFKYGSFSAALLALALGMASCHLEKKNGTDQSRAIKTEDITWEEKPSSEGCKLAAAYPTDNSSVVTQNIREWMNEQLGGTYTGSLDDGKKLLEYYGTERAEQVKRDIAEIGENTAWMYLPITYNSKRRLKQKSSSHIPLKYMNIPVEHTAVKV